MFLHMSVILSTGGACVVAPGGHAWLLPGGCVVAPRGGMRAWGAACVAKGGVHGIGGCAWRRGCVGGMHGKGGVHGEGGHVWQRGACMVKGGHAW